MFARSEAWWQNRRLHDDRHNRNGFTPFRFAVTESGGAVTGYVQYRYKAEWTDGHGAGMIRVVELFAADASALAGLWRYLLDHDLTAKVVAPHRAVDDPIFDLLAGRRRAKATIEDSLWIRIMDVKRALEGRRYSAPAATVLALHDPIDGSLTRWQLDLSPEGASVTPTSAEPEVTVDLEDLSAGLLGWPRFRELGRAGRWRALPTCWPDSTPLSRGTRHPGAPRCSESIFGQNCAPWSAILSRKGQMGCRSSSSWALRATITVDRLIRAAPTAGASTIPAQASTPAASGSATTL
jgi:hypothetical protein